MKGTFSVGVKAVTTTVTTTTATTGTTTGGGGGGTCTTPSVTITVGMREYAFDLSQTSVPAGCIQFNIRNNGVEPHNFDIQGVHAGAILSPGQTESWAVQLTAGNKGYVCDVPFHIDRGMVGSLAVT
jgi:uncharacterized cupredoxin-like copper-binding protein